MKDSKFTVVMDILGVIAFWLIAIGTIWQVYYTRLVYIQNKNMIQQSISVATPNLDVPSIPTVPDNINPNDYYIVPIPPSILSPDDLF